MHAYCTAVGWRLRGPQGAVVAWLASSIPASLIAVVATIFYERASSSRALVIVVLIGTGIALMLLLASAWHLARPLVASSSLWRSLAITGFAVVLFLFGVAPVGILLASAALGAAWTARSE